MTKIIYPLKEITDALKREEGFRSHVYQDTEGKWSLGFGRNVHPGSGLGISKKEAEYLLENDIRRTVKECEKAFPFFQNLNKKKMSVLVQLCFQLGLPSLRKFRRMLKHLELEEFYEASKELLDSKFARQVPERARRLSKDLSDD